MTRTAAPVTGYDIRLSIVDRPIHNHAHCALCQDIGSVIEVEMYLPLESGDGHVATKHVSCCATCVIPAIDSEPWLATDHTIVVEAYRGCTLRPF